jgi:hypothetical protein
MNGYWWRQKEVRGAMDSGTRALLFFLLGNGGSDTVNRVDTARHGTAKSRARAGKGGNV